MIKERAENPEKSRLNLILTIMKKLLFFCAMLIVTGSYAVSIPMPKPVIQVSKHSPISGSYTDVGTVTYDPSLLEFSADYDSSSGLYTLSVKVIGGVRLLQIIDGCTHNSSGYTHYDYWYGGTFYIDGGTVLLPTNSVYTSDAVNEGPVQFYGPGTIKFRVNVVDYNSNDMSVDYTVTIP